MDAFNSFVDAVKSQILNPLITLIALGAFAVFVWGVVEFIRNAGNEEKRREGQQHIIWGLVGLVIIFGAKAILAILVSVTGANVQ